MSKTFVIAGNHDQALRWVRQNITDYATTHGAWRSLSDYVIVDSEINLKGYSNPHGVFIGTWRERRDISVILHTIHFQSSPSNFKIIELLKELA